MKHANHQKGIALFIAVIAISALLLVTFSIADIAFKQQVISYAGRESKEAFYAADSGLECALYYDLRVADFFPVPPQSTPGSGTCDGQPVAPTVSPPLSTGNGKFSSATSTFRYNIHNGSDSNCVFVQVEKTKNIMSQSAVTHVTSQGYNTSCDTSTGALSGGARNVERALEVHY